jgi:putative transposase
MKKSRHAEEKIVETPRLHAAGGKAGELCRQRGISEPTLDNWKAKHGSMTVSEARRLDAAETPPAVGRS